MSQLKVTSLEHMLEAMSEIGIAAFMGDIPSIAILLKDDPALVYTGDKNGRTPLHWAVAGKQVETVKYLIGRHGADRTLSTQDAAGDTPMHLFRGPHPIIQLLHGGGEHTPPLDVLNDKGLMPVESIARANGFTTSDAQAAIDGLMGSSLDSQLSKESTQLFSFMRNSTRRTPPVQVRPAYWIYSLTMRDWLVATSPYATLLILAACKPATSAWGLGALFVAAVCGAWSAGGVHAFVRSICKLFMAGHRLALSVGLALALMLTLQNVLCLSHTLHTAPSFAILHVVCQCITLAAYAYVLTTDPGFVPGGANLDWNNYWTSLEATETRKDARGSEARSMMDGQAGGNLVRRQSSAAAEDAAMGAPGSTPTRTRESPNFCPRSELERVGRMRFSPYCNGSVMVMDHDCKYLGVCIGWGNHRAFMTFLCLAFVSIAAGIIFVVATPSLIRSMLPIYEPGAARTRLLALGLLLGLALLVPLGILIYNQLLLILCNVTTVEELRWQRKHTGSRPSRGTALWPLYAPFDKGSDLANLIAFIWADRGQHSLRGDRKDI